MFKLKNKSILIISNESWGDIWYSKHNWAYELSKKNIVFFINPPKKWSFNNLFSNKLRVEKYSDGLQIISYNNRLPFTRFEMIFLLNEVIVTKSITKWLKKDGINNTLFWSFDPYRFSSPKLLNATKSIFFRVDKFLLLSRERRLLKNVDGLIVTAKILLKGTKSKKQLVLSHGISEDEFVSTNDVDYEKDYLLYVGNIDFRIDVKLLKKLLIAFPDKIFLFIGRLIDTDNMIFQEIFFEKKYVNLIVHGVEHFKNLKNYIHKSEACLAPMDISIDGNEIHHHKSLQYMAMGKPIISPVFNDTVNKDEFILGYKNSEEAIRRISELDSTESTEKMKKRIIFAQQFLYSNLITKVENFLANK
jgi:hypothetical protein